MPVPRGHHLVAQFYQRGFARQRGKTWQVRVIERASGNEWVANVADTFKRRDWNTILDEDGRVDPAVEYLLAEHVDAPAAPVFAAMRSDSYPLDDLQREQLSRFMSAQLTRGRHIRKNLAKFMVETERHVLSLAAQNYSDERWMEIIGEVPSLEMRDMLINSADHFDIVPTNAGLLDTLLPVIDKVGVGLLVRRWTLVRFATPCLFTSEHPIIHINPSGHPFGYGTAMADQLYMPVSTTHGLLLSHPWADWPTQLVNGTRELARRLNWAVLTSPMSEELLLHPDVASYPLPGAQVLAHGDCWPWPEEEHGGGEMPKHWRRLLGEEPDQEAA